MLLPLSKRVAEYTRLRYLIVVVEVGKAQTACTRYRVGAAGSVAGIDNPEPDCLWHTCTAHRRCHIAAEHPAMHMPLDLNLPPSPQRAQPQHQRVRLGVPQPVRLLPYQSLRLLPLSLRHFLRLLHWGMNLSTVRHIGGTSAPRPKTGQTVCRVPA